MARDTMEPIAFIRKQLEEAEPDLLRDLLHDVVDRIMSSEVDGLAGAGHGERSPERTNRRNGYRGRRFDTRLGSIDLRIPKLRAGSYFPDWLLEPRRRSERALTQVIAEAYVLGVSTRRVDELVQALGITGMSKSQVSELATSLDADVASFRSRPLDGGPYRHVQADALAIKVREGGRIVQAAALVATGVNRDGHRVGAELFADTMYVGKLKGVGTVWQYTMVDGACSFGFARVRAGRKSAKSMAQFLIEDVAPVYRQAKIKLVRINTDGGPEFGKAFTRACLELGIEHHKPPPRSPDLNAFVERFQETCLHLHYRTAFRYRYYQSAADIDADLQAWLRHYNFERPHRGYRTKGRRPAELFYAHRPRLLKMKGWDLNEFTLTRQVV